MSLHVVSPLLHSQALSTLAGGPVFIKLDNVQPGGSFKIRGIGLTMQEAVKDGARQFVGSSGGNAGMAMAVAAKQLGKKLTIFIPRSTKAFVVKRLEAEGAEVVVGGENWDAANEEAVKAAQQENTFLVHPFDQATTWAGHSSIVEEVNDQLCGAPAAIVTCVGGGGLAMGIIQGMQKTDGWENTKLVCIETEGANCLAAARKAGGPVKLPAITSIATSLGALQVVQPLLDFCLDNPERVISIEVTDAQAKEGVVKFATDHRLLVEPACGAVLASIYSQLLPPLPPGPLVVVVCGGNLVTLDLVQEWATELKL